VSRSDVDVPPSDGPVAESAVEGHGIGNRVESVAGRPGLPSKGFSRPPVIDEDGPWVW